MRRLNGALLASSLFFKGNYLHQISPPKCWRLSLGGAKDLGDHNLCKKTPVVMELLLFKLPGKLPAASLRLLNLPLVRYVPTPASGHGSTTATPPGLERPNKLTWR